MDQSYSQQLINALKSLLITGTEVVFQDTTLSLVKEVDIKRLRWWPVGLLDCPYPVFLASKSKEGGVLVDSDSVSEDHNVQEIDEVFSDSPKPIMRQQSSCTENLDGSPLKLEVFADLEITQTTSSSSSSTTKEATKTSSNAPIGIPLSNARKLLSAFSISLKQMQSNMRATPFIVLCDGTDMKRTACLCIEALFSDEQKFIGSKISKVCVKDPTNDNSHLPKYEHMNLKGKNVQCEAYYSVVDNLDGSLKTGYQGSLFLESNWSASTLTNRLQPPLAGTTLVKATVISGNTRSAAYGLYQELTFLKALISGLKTGDMTWPTEESNVPILDKLKETIELLELGDAGRVLHVQGDDEFQGVMDTLMFDERSNLEFTDHLWLVLMKCTSFTELLDCLQHVFTVLGRGELQPRVNAGNEVTMAQLVRDSYNRKMRKPNLAGLYPLQLLAEMGAEKLHHDYVLGFLSKNLVIQDNLQPFSNSQFDLDKQIQDLDKLHQVLEMVVMLKMFLTLPTAILGSCAREMLRYFEENNATSHDVFNFKIPTKTVNHMFESHQPVTTKIVFSKTAEKVTEKEVHFITTELPFKHLPAHYDMLSDPDNENEKYFYAKKQESIVILV